MFLFTECEHTNEHVYHNSLTNILEQNSLTKISLPYTKNIKYQLKQITHAL